MCPFGSRDTSLFPGALSRTCTLIAMISCFWAGNMLREESREERVRELLQNSRADNGDKDRGYSMGELLVVKVLFSKEDLEEQRETRKKRVGRHFFA